MNEDDMPDYYEECFDWANEGPLDGNDDYMDYDVINHDNYPNDMEAR